MKKSLLLSAFLMFSAAAIAQKTESYPFQTVSKDVQRMQFKNKLYVPATIRTTDALPHSKGVALMQHRDSRKSTVVRMDGMPSSVISKGVARMQYDKSNK